MSDIRRLKVVAREFDRARKALAVAKGRAADDGMFAMRDTAYRLAVAELARAERRYNTAHAAWTREGEPDRNGVRHGRRRT